MNTKEMIEVMQAFEDGKEIEFKSKGCQHDYWKELSGSPLWDWCNCFFRIKPKQTMEDQIKAKAIQFAEWLNQLKPNQKVSVWSKCGGAKGLYTMDNEQLFNKFKIEGKG